MHVRAPYIAIPALQYPAQSVLVATRVVPGHESGDSRQCRRLLALAAVAGGRSRGEAVALGWVGGQNWPDWVHRFNAEGMDGLLDRKLGGRPSKLTTEQKPKFAAIVEAVPDFEEIGLARWHRVDLRAVIEERFRVPHDKRLHDAFSKLFEFA